MLKKLAVALVGALGIFVIVAMMQPAEYRVVRTVTVQAPADVVFAQVNDLQRWQAWSPWAKLDPNAKTEFEGPAAGKGAVMRWDGNMEVGKGSMTIAESRPSEQIDFALKFDKPLPGESTASFSFKASGADTVVEWSMQGKNNLIGKAMSLIFNCEKMIGEQFDKGLLSLKTVAESEVAKAAAAAVEAGASDEQGEATGLSTQPVEE